MNVKKIIMWSVILFVVLNVIGYMTRPEDPRGRSQPVYRGQGQ